LKKSNQKTFAPAGYGTFPSLIATADGDERREGAQARRSKSFLRAFFQKSASSLTVFFT
jgi:hypothetical protein